MTVYILKNENPEALLSFMSEQRLKKINDITAEKVKEEKICAFALLRYALFMEYEITELPVFTYGEREKPYLSNFPGIFFSMSHAGGFSACVVSGAETGMDLQDYRPMRDNISAKICTEKEIKEVYSSGSPSETTCRLWCMKESFGKLTGKGFGEVFDTIETSTLKEKGLLAVTDIILEDRSFYLSVCSYEPVGEIEIVSVTEKDIRYILS